MGDADAIVLIRAFMLTIAKSQVSVATFEKFQNGCLAVIDELNTMDKSMEGAESGEKP